MTCRDGTRLSTRLWTPTGSGPWPALLMRQPYGRTIASTVTYAHPRWYASHGFLVAVQDVRGRGGSEGTFSGFAQEAADGADCLRWLRQLPQCNGRVGGYGFSYQGLTQLLSDDPAQLPDCLAPAMAGPDERHHWASSGGAHWWALGLAWGLQLAAQGCQRRQDEEGWQQLRQSLESGAFLREGPNLLRCHDPQGMALTWLQQDPASCTGWRCHPLPEGLARRPMLLIGGWHDPHLSGVLALWHWARQAGGAPWLRIGAWGHLNWGGQLDTLQLAFFRHHLQGQPAEAILQSRIELQDSRSGAWSRPELDDQEHQGPLQWHLAPGRLLGPGEENAGGGELDLVHDPWRPVPGRGGHLGLDAGSCERQDLDQRNDVLCFTGQPLEVPLPLAGQPVLEISVQADQPGFDLCLALSAVSACGSNVRQLCTGVSRHLGASCLQQAVRQVSLQPLFTRLQPGERLRLSLAAAAWPQIAVNPGTGEQAWGGSSHAHRVVHLSLQLACARLQLLPLQTAAARAHWGHAEPSR
jgi:putative CocE/NonD family hydrolase